MKKLLSFFTFTILSFSLFSQLTWQALDAGTEFSVGIQSDGSLWTWGNNLNSELGLGDNNLREVPTQVGADTDWQEIACGAFHVIALKTNGTLWAWGSNAVYQLGNGNTNNSNEPIQIGTDNDWQFIAAGYAHNHAIKTNGTLWGWGSNFYGHIGDNSTIDIQTPAQISTDTDWEKVSSGAAHSMALKSNSSLWTTGTNLTGQLGIDGLNESYEFVQIGTANWIDVSCGHEYTSGIQSDSTIWSWGFNGNGQLGIGNNNQADEPTQVGTEDNWAKITCGSASNFAINSSGELYATGFNTQGTLGDGTGADRNSFEFVTGDVYNIWAAKGATESGSVFGHHTLLLKNASLNVICAAGANYTYQLGNGNDALNLSFECETGDLDVTSYLSENQMNTVLIYPNPTSDLITINLNDIPSANIVIYNSSGKRVKEKEIVNHEKISLKDFDAGIYFYEIIEPNGGVKSGKVVVN